MNVVLGVVWASFFLWFVARYAIGGFYTVGPNERAVLSTFGRAQASASCRRSPTRWRRTWRPMSANDPVGSLRANISNATVRCLSNMKLADMLEDRHAMSRAVRSEVSDKSQEWGYEVGSIYVRKDMTLQIEQKVVNRLRQVTGPSSRTAPVG